MNDYVVFTLVNKETSSIHYFATPNPISCLNKIKYYKICLKQYGEFFSDIQTSLQQKPACPQYALSKEGFCILKEQV